jgi:hypothetical protein
MEKNVGGVDRTLRIILGIMIIGAGIYYKSWWGLIGLVILISGIFGSCMLYELLGVNTCRVKK